MEEKKHIDRLYQEKFKDFEATPREAVWKNISSRLQEKERKKNVLPLWYRIAGVAAILALFINYASGLFKPQTSINNSSVSSTNPERNFGELRLVSSSYNDNMVRSSIILQALVQDTKNKELEEKRKEGISQQQNLSSPVLKETTTPFNEFLPQATPGKVAGTVPETKKTSETRTAGNLRKLPFPSEGEIRPEEESNSIKAKPLKRIRITTTAAPVFFDNLGNGSAIDASLAGNESSGEVSMAYGINFAYQISGKIKIRSGISKVDLSYNTRDIAFTAAVNPAALSGIDYKGGNAHYRIENSNNIRPFNNMMASTEFNRSSLASPAMGYLNQSLGFIEVPLEVEYVLIDKKIGLNLIGGGSTLFLNNNMVSLNSANFSTNIGEANNLNAVSFSTNIGVGVDYKISQQFQLNLEPIFKYQINTFNNTNNLNTYYFGIYSGFSFKF